MTNKPCLYCGEPVKRAETHSKEHTAKYCSRECFYSASRLDCQGYVGRFLDQRDISRKALQEAMMPYFSRSACKLQNIQRLCTEGLSHAKKSMGFSPKVTAMKVACAIHDLNPDMEDWYGHMFDYRLIIKGWQWNLHPPGDSIPVINALNYAGLDKRAFIGHIENEVTAYNDLKRLNVLMEETIAKTVGKLAYQLERLHESFEDSVPVLYGDVKWKKMLDAVLSKRFYCDAAVAYAIAEVLKHYQCYIDFRMLMEPLSPRDFVRNMEHYGPIKHYMKIHKS